jgi:hypothetical protein
MGHTGPQDDVKLLCKWGGGGNNKMWERTLLYVGESDEIFVSYGVTCNVGKYEHIT